MSSPVFSDMHLPCKRQKAELEARLQRAEEALRDVRDAPTFAAAEATIRDYFSEAPTADREEE